MTYQKSFAKTVLLTGLLAGVLDATAACIQYLIRTGKNPAIVFRYIASGVFGKDALTKSLYGMAAWGLLFHFIIAISFTLFFFLLYPQIRSLIKNKFITAFVYGIFAWSVMNLIVVPITFASTIHIDIGKAAIAAAILIVAIGLPVSLMADRYYSKK